VKKKQHNTESAVSEGKGRSQIPLMTWQQLQTPSPSGDTQFEISNSQLNESRSGPSQQDENEDEDKDDWKNDPSSLVDSDNEDKDNVETETLQNNRDIPSTQISLTNTELKKEDSSSTLLYTNRNVFKSKQKSNITKQQSKALAVHETRTSYNLQPSDGKLASVPFWKKTNLKITTWMYPSPTTILRHEKKHWHVWMLTSELRQWRQSSMLSIIREHSS
jgi:hypothetical protein